MQDIEYFKEGNMDSRNKKIFLEGLPDKLRSIVTATDKSRGDALVLHGWRGPKNLAMSDFFAEDQVLLPVDDVQEIQYFYNLTAKLNFIPISGNIGYLLSRAIPFDSWKSAYFDASSGDILTMVKTDAENLRKQNRQARDLNQQGDDLLSKNEYLQALVCFRSALNSAATNSYREKSKANIVKADLAMKQHEEHLKKIRDEEKRQQRENEELKRTEKLQEEERNRQRVLEQEMERQRIQNVERERQRAAEEELSRQKLQEEKMRFDQLEMNVRMMKLEHELRHFKDKEVSRLNETAVIFFASGNYQQAIQFFQQALSTATSASNILIIEKNIKNTKLAQSKSELENIWKEAWGLETNGKPQESRQKFQHFLIKVREFLLNSPDDQHLKKYKKMVKLKIDGNVLFNDGLSFCDHGIELLNESKEFFGLKNIVKAREKLLEAQKKFSAAAEYFNVGFNQGDSRFSSCINVARDMLQIVEDKTSNINELSMLHLKNHFREIETEIIDVDSINVMGQENLMQVIE